MRNPTSHFSDQDLLLAADGELPAHEAERVAAHLASCLSCRSRLRDLEEAMRDFILVRDAGAPLPAPDGPRAIFQLRLAHLAESWPLTPGERIAAMWQRPTALLACSAAVVVLLGTLIWRVAHQTRRPDVRAHLSESIPDPGLTPGVTLSVSRDDVCGVRLDTRVVPVEVAKRVFAAYGVESPEPRAYEVDYLITPALGGSDHIRNFWPQPYRNTIWNAHIKDALEDRLRELVCEGRLDLATAQQEIAANWIAAYKKYFGTQAPLPEHAAYLRDRPWE
jgi:hypothetical protein